MVKRDFLTLYDINQESKKYSGVKEIMLLSLMKPSGRSRWDRAFPVIQRSKSLLVVAAPCPRVLLSSA
jgi:hypothetical protein